MKFRKKPVVIEAVQFTADGAEDAIAFAGDDMTLTAGDDGMVHPAIKTLEGHLRVSEGDWIIRGVKGEHYPCKPDIFAATYEPVENA